MNEYSSRPNKKRKIRRFAPNDLVSQLSGYQSMVLDHKTLIGHKVVREAAINLKIERYALAASFFFLFRDDLHGGTKTQTLPPCGQSLKEKRTLRGSAQRNPGPCQTKKK